MIGNWRRIDPALENFKSTNPRHRPGDLSLFPDSAFIIYGTPNADTINTTGWHYGGDMKGTWTFPDKRRIMFKVDSKISVGVSYEIIKLDEKNLILAFPGDKDDSLFQKFVRL